MRLSWIAAILVDDVISGLDTARRSRIAAAASATVKAVRIDLEVNRFKVILRGGHFDIMLIVHMMLLVMVLGLVMLTVMLVMLTMVLILQV